MSYLQAVGVKNIGIFLLATGVILFLVAVSFTETLIKANEVLHASCPLSAGICPYTGFPIQSAIAFALDLAILTSGLYLISNSKRYEKTDAEGKRKFEGVINSLSGDDKKLFEMVVNENAVFQSDLVEKSDFPKAKVTRILDRLEARGLVERRRRGLTNVIMPVQRKPEDFRA